MLTVRIFYKDGTEEIKDCNDISDLCLDNVLELRIIRDEQKKVA